jgi:hypothetical protein
MLADGLVCRLCSPNDQYQARGNLTEKEHRVDTVTARVHWGVLHPSSIHRLSQVLTSLTPE